MENSTKKHARPDEAAWAATLAIYDGFCCQWLLNCSGTIRVGSRFTVATVPVENKSTAANRAAKICRERMGRPARAR
jgi:hypothetical protein